MRFSSTLISLGLPAALAADPAATEPALAAASPTAVTTAAATTGTTLPELIAMVPACALNCLAKASTNLGCAATDLTCVCRSSVSASASLAAQLGACILLSSCDSNELNIIESIAPKVCAQVSNAPSSLLSVISTEIAGELATASAATNTGTSSGALSTSSSSSSSPTTAGAAGVAPPAVARATMALLGIGGVAVLAAYIL